MEINDPEIKGDIIKDRVLLLLTVVLFIVGTYFVWVGLDVNKISIKDDNEAEIISAQVIKTINDVKRELNDLEGNVQ